MTRKNDKIIVISTSRQGRGGIAAVIKIHKKYFPELRLIATTPGKGSKSKKIFFLIKAFLKFIWLLIFTKVDIVHIHSASYNSFNRKYVFYKIASFFKKKIIFQIHGAEFHLFYKNSKGQQQRKIEKLLSDVDMVVCLSKEWKDFYSKSFKIKKLCVLNNVIDYPDEFDRVITKPIEFLFLGYIGERKGVWDICDVILENRKDFEGKIKINIAGNGQKDKLLKFIVKHNLSNLLAYVGWLDSHGKTRFLKESHVFLLPSYNEGLPISILEAMSYELPIISTNVGGIPNIVNEENGFLINPGDKAALKNAMKYFLLNPLEITHKGKNSKKFVGDFLPDSVLKQLKSIYESV